MNNLTTLNNQFVFNLPDNLILPNDEEKYYKLLGQKRKLYSSVIDYLNSTVQSITFPSIKFEVVSNPQNLARKQIVWKAVNNVYDLFDKTITITFLNVDSNINFMIMLDNLISNYLNTDTAYDAHILITIIDENRNALYNIMFKDVMWTGLDGNTFGFNDQTVQTKTFTATFTYNFIDIEFLGDVEDIIKT